MKYCRCCLFLFCILTFLPFMSFAQVWAELGTGAAALEANNVINTVAADKWGNVYAAGWFTDSNNRVYVAKWNGVNWTKLGQGFGYGGHFVRALAVDINGTLYAAGNLWDSPDTFYVAKWNGSTWEKLGFGSNSSILNGEIYCITTDASGNVYAAGYSHDQNNNKYVAKWDGTSWSQLGSGTNALNANGSIYALAADALGNVYAAGHFLKSNGDAYVAKWNGTSWAEHGAGIDYYVATHNITSLTVDPANNVYATGDFTNSGLFSEVIKCDGNNWSILGTGADAIPADEYIGCITADSHSNIYAAGSFVFPYNTSPVAKWNGLKWTPIGYKVPLTSTGASFAVVDHSFNIYICGDFTDSSQYYYVAKRSSFDSVYCNSNALGGTFDSTNIGRFVVGTDTFGSIYSHLANPAPVSSYVFNAFDTVHLFIDSSYHIQAAGIMNTTHDADAKITLFIDYNNNGQYDIPAERVWTTYSRAFYNYILDTNITIPSFAAIDTPIGMRLIINNDTGASTASDSACGTYISGETQDFVVVLQQATSAVSNFHYAGSGIRIYPNPLKDELFVSGAEPGSRFEIRSIAGLQLSYGDLVAGSQNISVSKLPPGLYILQVTSKDCNRESHKIVKQ